MNLDERARRAASALREHASTVDADAVLARIGDGRRTRRWAVPVAAAATAAAVVAAVLVLPDALGDRRPRIDPVAPGVTEPPPDADLPDGWQQVPHHDSFGGDDAPQEMRAVATDGRAVAAVGVDGGAPRWWRSRDGTSWFGSARLADAGEVNDVVAFGGGFVAVGSQGGSPTVHILTADGSSSTAEGEAGSTATLTAVIATADGLVAVGNRRPEDGATSSPFAAPLSRGGDLLDIGQEVPLPAPSADVEVADVVALDGVLVAAGTDRAGDRPVLWRSTDGERWEQVELDPRAFPDGASVDALGTVGRVLLAGGAVGGAADADAAVWSSLDGRSWGREEGEFRSDGEQRVLGFAEVGGTAVAVGVDVPRDATSTTPAVWRSEPEPAGWVRQRDREAFGRPGAILDAAPLGPDGVVAVGLDVSTPSDDTDTDAAVWVNGAPSVRRPPTTPPSADGACEATGGDAPEQEGLPAAVAETRRRIWEAASRCDYGALADLATDGGTDFTYSFGEDGQPAAYWRRRADDGEPIASIVQRLLELPHAVDGDVRVWPAAFVEPTDRNYQALVDAGLYTDEDVERFRAFGGYVGYRIGITAGGDWLFLVAGD